MSWPGSALPAFWKGFSYFFPSTFGVNGFLKINNMGGELTSVRTEWTVLWAQAIVYFLTTCLVYRNSIIASRRRFIARYRELKARKKA
mgnify:FL=1